MYFRPYFYPQAGAQFKIAKNWISAGQAFAEAGNLFLNKCGDRSDGIASYAEAGRAYSNEDAPKAIYYLQLAGQMQMDDNRFSPAAKFFGDIATLYADKLDEPKKAIEANLLTADCYYNTNSKTTAHSYLVKACDLYVVTQQYSEAVALWEKICSETPESMSSRVEDYCFKALLVTFMIEAKARSGAATRTAAKIEEYNDKYPRTEDSPKFKFIGDLVVAYNDMDEPKFSETLHKYDRIYKIDNFTASMLYEVKKAIIDYQNSAVLETIEVNDGIDLS